MSNLRGEVLSAIDVAIEGRAFLQFKWEGEYGEKYDSFTKESRIKDIKADRKKLSALKARVKARKRL